MEDLEKVTPDYKGLSEWLISAIMEHCGQKRAKKILQAASMHSALIEFHEYGTECVWVEIVSDEFETEGERSIFEAMVDIFTHSRVVDLDMLKVGAMVNVTTIKERLRNAKPPIERGRGT